MDVGRRRRRVVPTGRVIATPPTPPDPPTPPLPEPARGADLAGAPRHEPPGPAGPYWPEFADSPWRPAGFWRRLLAAGIDAAIVIIVSLGVLWAFSAIFSFGLGGDHDTLARIAGVLVGLCVVAVVALLYAPTVMAHTGGRTLGKLVLGLRVIRLDGGPMGFGWSALREVAVKLGLFVVALGPITFGMAWIADLLWPLWDGEHRALHDMVARTRVVRS